MESAAQLKLTRALCAVYLLVLGWILLLKLGVQFSYMSARRVNLVPFRYTTLLNGETLLNVLVFVPLGLYVALLFYGWPFLKKAVLVFAVSVGIESLQYGLRIGAFDVTDVITNTLGGVVGLLMVLAFEKALGTKQKAQKLVNLVALVGTIAMITLLALLKLNLLPIRYQ